MGRALSDSLCFLFSPWMTQSPVWDVHRASTTDVAPSERRERWSLRSPGRSSEAGAADVDGTGTQALAH